MREIFKSGSVGGAPGNRCFYLEPDGAGTTALQELKFTQAHPAGDL
jgi:hypothetical protein